MNHTRWWLNTNIKHGIKTLLWYIKLLSLLYVINIIIWIRTYRRVRNFARAHPGRPECRRLWRRVVLRFRRNNRRRFEWQRALTHTHTHAHTSGVMRRARQYATTAAVVRASVSYGSGRVLVYGSAGILVWSCLRRANRCKRASHMRERIRVTIIIIVVRTAVPYIILFNIYANDWCRKNENDTCKKMFIVLKYLLCYE